MRNAKRCGGETSRLRYRYRGFDGEITSVGPTKIDIARSCRDYSHGHEDVGTHIAIFRASALVGCTIAAETLRMQRRHPTAERHREDIVNAMVDGDIATSVKSRRYRDCGIRCGGGWRDMPVPVKISRRRRTAGDIKISRRHRRDIKISRLR